MTTSRRKSAPSTHAVAGAQKDLDSFPDRHDLPGEEPVFKQGDLLDRGEIAPATIRDSSAFYINVIHGRMRSFSDREKNCCGEFHIFGIDLMSVIRL